MTEQKQYIADERPVRRLEYDDGSIVLASDLGPGRDASVDVVGETVIVVADDEQYEFEAPTDGAQAFIKNGVLTVEVEG